MRVIGLLANILLLSVLRLTTGAPLTLERIHPKTVFAIGGPTHDHTVAPGPLLPAESLLGDQISLSFESGCLAGDSVKGSSLSSVVKSVRPIRRLKDAHAEVVIYLQDLTGLPIDAA